MMGHFNATIERLPGLRDGLPPVREPGGMMAARLLERPINEVLSIGEGERLCDSTRVDNRVRPFRVISQCSKPAEWIYVMKCSGGRRLPAIHAMSNIYSARFTSVTAPTARIRSVPWPTARVPSIGCRAMAMRLEDTPPLRLAQPAVGITRGWGAVGRRRWFPIDLPPSIFALILSTGCGRFCELQRGQNAAPSVPHRR